MRGRMDELTLQWIQISKFIPLALFASLYAFGGMSGKWKRRFLAPAILVTSFVIYTLILNKFSWWILLCYPIYCIALSMGYGADELWKKILKRGYCGIAISLGSLPLAIAIGSVFLWYVHLVLMTSMMIILGTWNPTPSARNEETTIGIFASLLPLFMI